MEELKPCPFCGYKKVYVPNPFSATKHVFCYNCGTEGPIGMSEKEACELWNRRVEDDGRLHQHSGGD